MPPRGQQRIRDLHGTGTADRLVVMVLLSLSVYEGIIRLSVVGSRKSDVSYVIPLPWGQVHGSWGAML